MVIINTKTGQVYYVETRTGAAELIGVNRMTVTRWQAKRIADKTYVEVYNNFTLHFNVVKVS